MTRIGYTLSSEEFRPSRLVDLAGKAKDAGFPFAGISDHYHPWMDTQGQSPFVWAVLGGIAARTSQLQLITGVTAPIMRIHPAIIAQAAATVADMLPGRFVLGVGTGEALNEHIVGEVWPPVSIRQEMLREAVEIIRALWQGDYQTVQGDYFDVFNARLYTLPEQSPPIYIAASGPETGTLAGEIGDGMISTAPDAETVEAFNNAGTSRPKIAQHTLCWAENEDEAAETARKYWGYTALPGQVSQELPLTRYFQEMTDGLVTPEMVKEKVTCGPDPDVHRQAIQKYLDAGFDDVYLHQVGPDQEGFFEFAKREILPRFS